jgi:LCT (Lysosomal Cystine Transporter) family transporter
VVGLNFDWQILNLVGFSCYSAYMFGLFWNQSLRAQYAAANNGAEPSVQTNDVFFGFWATIMSIIILLQIAIYERGGQKVSRICWIAIAGMLIAIAVMAACAGLKVNDGKFSWLDMLIGLSYIKLGITVVKYAPQVVQNYRRKSTIGFSIENILLDITGGSLSLAQALLDNGIKHEWGAILGGNPAKFFLGLASMVYDCIFLTQHYCLYAKNNKHILAIEEAQKEARRRGMMVGEIHVPTLVGGSNSKLLGINSSSSVGGGDSSSVTEGVYYADGGSGSMRGGVVGGGAILNGGWGEEEEHHMLMGGGGGGASAGGSSLPPGSLEESPYVHHMASSPPSHYR